MIEVWKDIEGYEGLYQVSNLGSIKRLERYDTYKSGIVHHYDELILTPRINKFGYYYLDLSKDRKANTFRVHCIVTRAFIPNPNNLPCINHKDENKLNNYIHINEDGSVNFEKSNLEWCTHAYNCNYGTKPERLSAKLKGRVFSDETKKKMSAAKKGKIMKCSPPKPIIAFDGEHKLGTCFRSATDAADWLNKKSCGDISRAANGKVRQAYGYTWEFV